VFEGNCGMNRTDKIAVCSRSFSRNQQLRAELLARYEKVTFNETGRQLEGDDLIAFLRGHNKAITALERIDERILTSLPELRAIGKYGVGLDMIDINAMRRHGRRLGWTGGVNRRSVSELVISFAIALLRKIPAANREVLSGTWRQSVGGLLSERTVGIVGCGHVGKDLVGMLKPFRCGIIVNDIRQYADFYAEHGIIALSLEALLSEADVVTIHVPYDSSTRNLINAQRLALMKPASILINTARGGIVDESALKQCLLSGGIAAAAFDVFSEEPPSDEELLNLPNFLATPHIGGSAAEAILEMGRAAIRGLDENALP
jgi:D-3-phosphoglycerate dehydrogenase